MRVIFWTFAFILAAIAGVALLAYIGKYGIDETATMAIGAGILAALAAGASAVLFWK